MSRLTTKPTKWHVRPTKTQISLGISSPGWSESSLGAQSLCWFCREAAQVCLDWFNVAVNNFSVISQRCLVGRPAKTQISLDIRPVWSESSLSAWRKLGSLATHWAHSKDSDQTGRLPRLIWVFAGRTVILLVLSWGGSIIYEKMGKSMIQILTSILDPICIIRSELLCTVTHIPWLGLGGGSTP